MGGSRFATDADLEAGKKDPPAIVNIFYKHEIPLIKTAQTLKN
jgi:hypothetical protein